jgi:hypothetical protein
VRGLRVVISSTNGDLTVPGAGTCRVGQRGVVTRRLAPVVLLSTVLLAACTSGGGSSAAKSTATPSGTPVPATATATAPATVPAPRPASTKAGTTLTDEAEPASAGPAFTPATGTSTSPATGHGLTLVGVRTAAHDGYDRVVLELAGTGAVGWRVAYDAHPQRQGSGDAVVLAGAATLSVLLDGVGYPQDTGVREYSGPRRIAPSLPSVRELQVGGVFEGQLDAFVGVAAQRPFRVYRLAAPQRVVIDVRHTG